MLLFVFGFVGGAVVINSAVLVSLSVLLLVHYSVSNGLPAITHSLPRISRYTERGGWVVGGTLCVPLWEYFSIALFLSVVIIFSLFPFTDVL